MNETSDDLLIDAFERLLGDLSGPDAVRAIETGGAPHAMWASLAESGFADALLPESSEGAGLRLSQAFDLVLSCGSHALPLPLAQTMLVRAVGAAAGIEIPDGPIAIAPPQPAAAAVAPSCRQLPFGAVAQWVVLPLGETAWVLPAAEAEHTATGVHASLQANLRWSAGLRPTLELPGTYPWMEAGAALTAALIAGAMRRVLEMTVRYCGERVQFGRSIGKFQAVQQQVSVMAEHVFAARMAAELGCQDAAGPQPSALGAALAKSRTSEAAAPVAAIAHGVHGAIGVTDEYDLHLYTRRLLEWRLDYGSEAYWNRRLGAAVLGSAAHSTLDFIRSELAPAT